MLLSLKDTRLALRNSTTRLPFRYGKACLTRCPQAVLAATIEADAGVFTGYSGDCFPPGWFDKSPGKSFSEQIDDMIAVIRLAEKMFREEFSSPTTLFAGWMIASERIHRRATEWGLTPLLASFGVSMIERALIDAVCRAANRSFAQAVRENLFAIEPGDVHDELQGRHLREWLPDEPARSIHVRHTVGLADPLTPADIPPDERLDDGFPQALVEYIEQSGVRYLKIKVANQLAVDIERLTTIASLIERHRGKDYAVTLDGNEQYKSAEEFDALIAAIRHEPKLQTLFKNVLVIEQPLERSIALSEDHTAGIRELSREKPVIIDESDGTLNAYRQAIRLGYRGVSSKNCKGPLRSLLNAGMTWFYNDEGRNQDYVVTGEDLCTVGVVPVQADLCLVATLGLTHVERNGHHYHPGLSYLPEGEREAALAAHGDFYARQHGIIAPRVVDGRFEIGSLVDCAGFGFAALPDVDAMTPADAWEYSSLGLE